MKPEAPNPKKKRSLESSLDALEESIDETAKMIEKLRQKMGLGPFGSASDSAAQNRFDRISIVDNERTQNGRA